MNVPIPEKMEFIEENGQLIIRKKWFGVHLIFLTLFCIFWCGFLVVWYGIAFSDDTPLMMKLFPLGHVAVGVGLLYYVIAGYFNKTDIIIDSLNLEVKHYPVKWFGNKCIDVADIKQLYTSERVTNNKNGTTITYKVNVIDNQGRSKGLVGGLESKEQGLFIERKIEEILGILDEEVSGAVK